MKTSFSDLHDSERPPAASPEEGFAVEPSTRVPRASQACCPPLAKWMAGGALVLCLLGAAALWTYLSFPEDAGKQPAETPKLPEARRKELAKNIFFEVQGDVRRVILKAEVCLREGPQLEGLLCRKMTKEHEYILHVDADARQVHTALMAAGARPGSPVKFEPRYAPATGSTIKITLQYQKDGKLVRVPAQDWILDGKHNKALQDDWVFGGSILIPDPDDPKKPPLYLANHGDMVCVCNMESAMLDLPVRSPKKFEDRVFKPFTERIPPLDTPVDVIMEAVPDRKVKDR
jgi:hypothetical protein